MLEVRFWIWNPYYYYRALGSIFLSSSKILLIREMDFFREVLGESAYSFTIFCDSIQRQAGVLPQGWTQCRVLRDK